MSTSSVGRTGFDRLAVVLDGSLTRPGDPDWDAARQAWQLAVDQRPTAVVRVGSVRDVVAVVDAARALGLRVAPQGTGHNAGPLGPLDDTILLGTSALREVRIDPRRRVARVQAGARWVDVTGAAAEEGLAVLAGSAPDVGVVGYTLGGGLSWFARSHGLAANHVVAIEVVTADGRHRRVDAEHEPDLFWALRGGGGSFAVVTALEFTCFPITEVHAGVLFWPIEAAREVLHVWRRLLPTLPDSVTSVGRLLRFPPLPDLPPHLRGRSYVVVEAACQNSPEEVDALLGPLRALGPQLDTFRPTPVAELGALHMDPDGPVPAFGDGMLLTGLTEQALDAFVDAAGPGSGSVLLSAELRHLGGALAPGVRAGGVRAGGAVSALDAAFAVFGIGITPDAGTDTAVRASVDALQRGLACWGACGTYLNFAERPKAGNALFGDSTHARLQEVKSAYDPGDVIRSNHPVRPAG
jgi:FAD binding domain/Berberine and berberine like